MIAVKLESLVRGKRATPRLAVVNKIAERTTLTSPRSVMRRRFPVDPERDSTLPRVVNVRIFPRGNSLARRAFPRDYLYLGIIEDRINKVQFKKRGALHSPVGEGGGEGKERTLPGRRGVKIRSRFWLQRISSRVRDTCTGKSCFTEV